jgi:hypothetical protein
VVDSLGRLDSLGKPRQFTAGMGKNNGECSIHPPSIEVILGKSYRVVPREDLQRMMDRCVRLTPNSVILFFLLLFCPTTIHLNCHPFYGVVENMWMPGASPPMAPLIQDELPSQGPVSIIRISRNELSGTETQWRCRIAEESIPQSWSFVSGCRWQWHSSQGTERWASGSVRMRQTNQE